MEELLLTGLAQVWRLPRAGRDHAHLFAVVIGSELYGQVKPKQFG